MRLARPMYSRWDMAAMTLRLSHSERCNVEVRCTRCTGSGKGWIGVGFWAAGTLRVEFMAGVENDRIRVKRWKNDAFVGINASIDW